MDWFLPLSGLVLGATAVVFSFRVAGDVKAIVSGANILGEKHLKATLRQLWTATGGAIGAGAIQSFEGDIIIATVWALFILVQGFNINAVHGVMRRGQR